MRTEADIRSFRAFILKEHEQQHGEQIDYSILKTILNTFEFVLEDSDEVYK